jgi:PEP-CTERM motif
MKQSMVQILTMVGVFLVLAASAQAVPIPTDVPEASSTVLLLGIAVLGLGVVRRFLKR